MATSSARIQRGSGRLAEIARRLAPDSSEEVRRLLVVRGERLDRLTNAVPQWTRIRNWTLALLAFNIHFGDQRPDTAI